MILTDVTGILGATGISSVVRSVKSPVENAKLLNKGYFGSDTEILDTTKRYFGIRIGGNTLPALISAYAKNGYSDYKANVEKDYSVKFPKSLSGLRSYYGTEDTIKGIVGYSAKKGEFTISSANKWMNFIDIGAGGTLKKITSLVGGSVFFDWFGFQIWDGTNPPQFQIPIVFNAQYDALYEVVIPILILYSLALPHEGPAGYLYPPGQTAFKLIEDLVEKIELALKTVKEQGAAGAVAGTALEVIDAFESLVLKGAKKFRSVLGISENPEDYSFSLFFGDFMYFVNMILTDISVSFDMSKLNRNGLPLSGTVQCSFRKQQIYTAETALGDIGIARQGVSKYIQIKEEAVATAPKLGIATGKDLKEITQQDIDGYIKDYIKKNKVNNAAPEGTKNKTLKVKMGGID